MSQSTLVPERQEAAASEDMSQLVSKIRDTVNNVPPERYDEIFSEFAQAVRKRDIKALADTVANWAVSLPKMKERGEIVNRALDDLPPLSEDSEVYASIQEFKAYMRASESSGSQPKRKARYKPGKNVGAASNK